MTGSTLHFLDNIFPPLNRLPAGALPGVIYVQYNASYASAMLVSITLWLAVAPLAAAGCQRR